MAEEIHVASAIPGEWEKWPSAVSMKVGIGNSREGRKTERNGSTR
jgi:hypothetical protein